MMTTQPLAKLAVDLIAAVGEGAQPFDGRVAAAVRDALGASAVALWRPAAPEWRRLAAAPATLVELPEAAAEALDAERPTELAGWFAIPIASPDGGRQGDVLVLRAPTVKFSAEDLATLVESARTAALATLQDAGRTERLAELVSLSLEWGESSDTAALLERMAEAATRLFDCDRATIFLWKRSAAQLVGRPALGMPDNQLTLPEDAGVVGRVVQSGEPLRTSLRDAEMVDRATDKSTGYRTDSLLCVPLDAPGGERLGAFELINKRTGEFSDDDVSGLLEFARLAAVAVANAQQVEELVRERDALVEQAASGVRMLGEAPAIAALRKTIQRVADADLAVLVLGENGTGKEVVAQSLHFQSRRRNAPLLAVNCAAIAESLLESELFGHERGAFTDARESRAGKFELADGGTLLLDEIGDMSPGGQAKLLRVLEDKTVVRVGGAEERKVDVRVVAATNRDLSERVREGKFREDLFYRLCVVTIELPPLRDRGDDVILLAEHFLKNFCQTRGRKAPKFSAAAKRKLTTHNWPGNIRELRNLMERVAYLTDEATIDADELSIIDRGPTRGAGGELAIEGELTEATYEFQRRYINQAVERARGNVAAAARSLGLHRSNLYRKMGQLGMDSEKE
ncbi:Nitrogen fixation protein VnfA [Botrimarina colliarenosi]|uniref:Nitrogen fixation protein VnfA n=1 Tax=Botrimarina colliarenosi TaxID=2528001 RepID=A0A5C6AKL8_9BACT|nr:sigma-54-dependent Fis family transcriptional regulator [Botrimarina colliarenosi]TWU00200.1 Nitrogen fixation protein VnfA [Botrimarina colliarenosi]